MGLWSIAGSRRWRLAKNGRGGLCHALKIRPRWYAASDRRGSGGEDAVVGAPGFFDDVDVGEASAGEQCADCGKIKH